MAGDHDRNRIGSARLSDCARGLGAIDRLRNVEIRPGRARRNREQLVPDLALEIRPLKVEREHVVEFVAGYSLLNDTERSLEWGIVPFDFGLRESRPQVLLCSVIRLSQAYGANTPIGGGDEYATKRTFPGRESNFHARNLAPGPDTLHTH